MAVPLISVEGLGKRYRIQHRGGSRYTALRDVIAEALSAPFTRRTETPASEEDFWALRDVSFEVQQGDVLGIIGRNGAGKSTLLKILSRITEPTEGRVTLRGRAASLLEVGTGFHPELTGRDNIFLNGAILGMSRAEIARKFDEIVAFAGTERFLDTPVKRYSSGMYVRLAFAVAAHLEPEILIIDEVLAVGDAEFQQKCLGKIGEVARSGRTVLFVSHQLAMVDNLCRTGLLLDSGRVRLFGSAREVIAAYAQKSQHRGEHSFDNRPQRRGNGAIRFLRARIVDRFDRPVDAMACGGAFTFEFVVANPSGKPLRAVHLSIGIDNALGQRITTWSTTYAGGDFSIGAAAEFVVRVRLPRVALTPGDYSYNIYSLVNGDVADWIPPAGSFVVEPGDFFGSGQLPEQRDGVFLADHSFSVESVTARA
jgi:lipopolysaccharide transport system ATP-binding protein